MIETWRYDAHRKAELDALESAGIATRRVLVEKYIDLAKRLSENPIPPCIGSNGFYYPSGKKHPKQTNE